MKKKTAIGLVTCQNYSALLKTVLNEKESIVAKNYVLISKCFSCNVSEAKKKEKKIIKLSEKVEKIKFLLPEQCCGLNFSETDTKFSYQKMGHCFEMLLPESEFCSLIENGNYLLTESWLDKWKYYLLEEWGFNQETAIDFFKESARYLTLLQVKKNKSSVRKLKKMAEFVQLDYKIISLKLDYFRNYVSSIIQKESEFA